MSVIVEIVQETPVPTINLSCMTPEARALVLKIARRHNVDLLRRLHRKALDCGPDGDLLQNSGEIARLGVLIEVLEQES